MISDLGIETLSFQDLQLPFHQYIFSKEHPQLHVFIAGGKTSVAPTLKRPLCAKTTATGAASWLSWPDALIVVNRSSLKGPDASQEAWAALAHELPRIIRR